MTELGDLRSDVDVLKDWRETTADPAINEIKTLSRDRQFVKGALWVIGVLVGAVFAIMVAMSTWALGHINFDVHTTQQTISEHRDLNASELQLRER